MDFAGMKLRELQALCAEHGLAARGSKADLAASLAGATSAAGSAAAASEKVVEAMVGKGCLKRSGDDLSGSSSGAVFKKVTFSFKEKEEAGEALVAAKVSRRGRQQKCMEAGSYGEGVAGEVCADAQVMWSMTDVVNLRAGSGIVRCGNLAEEEQEVVGAIVDRKRRTHGNPKSIAASSQAGVSHRSTRKSISSAAVDIVVLRQNDPAEIEGEDIREAGPAEAGADRKVVRKAVDSKRKQKTLQNAKSIAANAHARTSRRSTRKSMSSIAVDTSIQSQNDPAENEGEVIGVVGRTKLKWETTGKLKVGETLPAAAVSGRGCHSMCTEERGSTSSVEGVTGQVGADARETRSKRNAANLCAGSRVESQNILAEPEEDGKVVQKAVDSKRKQRTLQNAKNIAANARPGISLRSKRGSSLSADDVLLCPIVENKRGRRTVELDKKSAEVLDLPAAPSPLIIESKGSKRKEEDCNLVLRKSAKAAVSGRVTRSRSVNTAAVMPVVIENKSEMKTETLHLGRLAPAVSKSDVPTNDAPVSKSLRSRALQNNNTMLEEAHVGKKLENKRRSRGSAIGSHQPSSSSVEEEGQAAAAAPYDSPQLHENADVGKRPPVRRSARNHVVASRT